MEKILEIVFLLLKEAAAMIDKLRKGEIDPEKVDIQKWIDKLEALKDLGEDPPQT
jgi:hypothetical protein